jgi:5-methylcytosine-specific restriction protein A
MPKLRTLGPLVRKLDTNTVRFPPKVKAPIYNTPEFQTWRAAVVARAGGRCEWVDQHGHRCGKGRPEHRVYADHIVELNDGGHPFDVANGQALCASHHTLKTMAARARRLQAQNL